MLRTSRAFVALAALPLALACPTPPDPVVPTLAGAPEPARAPLPSPPSETSASQLALDHPRVVPFLHLEISQNVPLKLFAGPDLAPGAAHLRAGGQPVQLVSQAEARVILASKEKLADGTSYRIHVRVPPEGAVGHVDVALRDNAWVATGASMAEH
jgi:hypothetical protein